MTDKKSKKKKAEQVKKDSSGFEDNVAYAKDIIDEKTDILTEKAKWASKKVGEFAHDAEEKIDQVAHKTKAYISSQWKEDFEEFRKETGHKLEIVADWVEHMAEGLEEIAQWLFPDNHTGSDVTYSPQRSSEVNRLFIFRFLWLIIEGPIIYIWTIRYALISIYHIVLMLINGKRDRGLWNRQQRFWRHIIKWKAYTNGIIDRRPLLIEK